MIINDILFQYFGETHDKKLHKLPYGFHYGTLRFLDYEVLKRPFRKTPGFLDVRLCTELQVCSDYIVQDYNIYLEYRNIKAYRELLSIQNVGTLKLRVAVVDCNCCISKVTIDNDDYDHVQVTLRKSGTYSPVEIRLFNENLFSSKLPEHVVKKLEEDLNNPSDSNSLLTEITG